MPAPSPIFASESSAAKMLDMKLADFRRLVEQGDLPPPREIGGLKRWDIEEIRGIISGEAVDGMVGVQW